MGDPHLPTHIVGPEAPKPVEGIQPTPNTDSGTASPQKNTKSEVFSPADSILAEKLRNIVDEESNVVNIPTISEPTFPEGGLQAWLTVIGGMIMVFCTFGSVQSFGVFEDHYARVRLTNYTPSQISWIISVQAFLLFMSGPFAGKLFDAGYARHSLIYGSFLYIFSSFMLSLTKPQSYYQHFLAQAIGMGLANGFIFLPAISIASHHFKVRRAVATGVVMSGSSVGAVVKSVMLNTLINRPSAGFAWAVRCRLCAPCVYPFSWSDAFADKRAVAFMELGMLIVANLLIKTRLPPKPKSTRPSVFSFLKDFTFVSFLIGTTFAMWGIFIPYFYIQLFSSLHKVPVHIATNAVSIMNAASFFGRTTPNFVAQRWGNHNVMIPCTLITGALVWSFLGATHVSGVVLFAIFYGFFSGGFITLCVPSCISYSRDVSDIGSRTGLQGLVFAFAFLTGGPIAGALLSPPKFLWWRPLLFASVLVLTGAFFMIVARIRLAKRKGTRIV
jgi:MFS family permease